MERPKDPLAPATVRLERMLNILPRLAHPLLPHLLWRGPATDRIAYLTFDDGPTPKVTPQLLEVLARRRVPATFFLVGHRAQQHPNLVRAIASGGHSFGNHSYLHGDPWRISRTRLLREYAQTNDLLERLTERPVPWLRPPYGHYTPATGRWCARQRQSIVMWDAMPGDFLPSMTASRLVRRLLRITRAGSIIVLHDNHQTATILPEALDAFLEVAASKGFCFRFLDAATSST